MNRIGASAGLTLRKLGGVVISGGSLPAAVVRADCTSSAALSMSRSRSNCSVIWLKPSEFTEVIELTPEMVENCRSSGVATEAAIDSGPAPGRVAVTWMVGKSTRGSAAIGSCRKPNRPAAMNDSIKSVVITGRRIQISGRLIA